MVNAIVPMVKASADPEESSVPDDRIACDRCGSVDIEVNERPVPQQPTGDWPYVDRAVLRCRRCHHHWIRVDVVRAPVSDGSPTARRS
jgi:hypothetical protein